MSRFSSAPKPAPAPAADYGFFASPPAAPPPPAPVADPRFSAAPPAATAATATAPVATAPSPWPAPVPYPPGAYQPGGYQPAAAAPAPVSTGSESGLVPKAGLLVTVLALVLSLVYQVGGRAFIHSSDVIDVSLRRALVVNVGFYVVVGLGLLAFVLKARVNLVWHRHGVPHALLLGLPLGLGGGLVAVAINSASTGHLASDPNVTLLVGGGGAARLFLVFATTSVLAPLVEETIFRGICAGSLVGRNVNQAIWASAIAFSIWHLNPAALRYYALMGLAFAGMWLKRGLLASMSAHAAFNGVLTVAAVMATGGSATATTFNAISVTLPGGWHIDNTQTAPDRELVIGPSGSGLILLMQPPEAPGGDPIAEIEDRLTHVPVQTGIFVDPTSIREITTSMGTAVTGDFTIENQPGHVLEFPYNGSTYKLIIVTAGNGPAERAWPGIIDSLHAS